MGRSSQIVRFTLPAAVLAAVVVHAAVYGDAVLANSVYLGVLVCAAAGAWVGAERAGSGSKTVPRLIAAGISFSALGDLLWTAVEGTGADTDVSIADPAWFASYVFLCAALWMVLRRSQNTANGRLDVDFVIDALTIVVVSVAVLWNTSVDSIISDESVSPFVRAVWAAYPVADGVLLALVVRVLMTQRTRAAIDMSFAAGVCLWLAADIAYLHTPGDTPALVVMDSAWMVAPALLARSAWRARDITAAASSYPARGGRVAQLVVAVGTLAVPASLELVNRLRGLPAQPALLFFTTAALLTLASIRTARLLNSETRARKELEEARDVALEASQAKSMFLANMSHEIRTPLTTVLAVGEILEDTSLDPEQRELLGRMHRSGEVLKALVERTLDFSRIEAGRIVLASTDFDLHALVTDLSHIYEPRAMRCGIGFDYVVDPRLPRRFVGDPNRIFEILTNLLDNAMKFTENGKVALHVRQLSDGVVDEDGVDDVVEFVVEDTGVGIPAAAQNAVFDSFTQVDGSATRRHNGSGLGLAICKNLVQLMGGSIDLQSQPSAGSRFVIRIPLQEPPKGPGPGHDRVSSPSM